MINRIEAAIGAYQGVVSDMDSRVVHKRTIEIDDYIIFKYDIRSILTTEGGDNQHVFPLFPKKLCKDTLTDFLLPFAGLIILHRQISCSPEPFHHFPIKDVRC